MPPQILNLVVVVEVNGRVNKEKANMIWSKYLTYIVVFAP